MCLATIFGSEWFRVAKCQIFYTDQNIQTHSWSISGDKCSIYGTDSHVAVGESWQSWVGIFITQTRKHQNLSKLTQPDPDPDPWSCGFQTYQNCLLPFSISHSSLIQSFDSGTNSNGSSRDDSWEITALCETVLIILLLLISIVLMFMGCIRAQWAGSSGCQAGRRPLLVF